MATDLVDEQWMAAHLRGRVMCWIVVEIRILSGVCTAIYLLPLWVFFVRRHQEFCANVSPSSDPDEDNDNKLAWSLSGSLPSWRMMSLQGWQ